VVRSYDDAVWYPQKSVVSYVANYTMDQTSPTPAPEQNADDTI